MRLDAQELKESLALGDIKKLLIELGSDELQINEDKGEIISNTICHNTSGGSYKLYYSDKHKGFMCFTRCSCTFDIYILVKKVFSLKNIELSFPDQVNWVKSKSGKGVKLGFGSEFIVKGLPKENEDLEWLSNFGKKKVEHPPLEIHSDRILNVFSEHMSHPEFTLDGISPEAMDTFEVKYYNKENALIIPHRDADGNLIGMMNRNLNKDAIEHGFKYIPTKVQDKSYRFSKHQNLYGWHKNQHNIARIKKAAIFESEKSVLQAETMFGRELNFTVALGGSNISEYQINLLLKSGIQELFICLDKMYQENGTKEEENYIQFLLRIGRKFSPYVRTYVLFDTEGLLEYKSSPSDYGKDVLIHMMKNKQEILNIE